MRNFRDESPRYDLRTVAGRVRLPPFAAISPILEFEIEQYRPKNIVG